MSGPQFNIALVIFFVPYVLCDPSNILLGNLSDHRHKLEYLAVADILFQWTLFKWTPMRSPPAGSSRMGSAIWSS
ncbi:hypothetical protein I7I50_03092 [Histoplasma capsulatum G186AR]|uniref:Uncharacterized protein n=1 Tax=Ajellomyces capsulatus TaxID=5037 RepID=A0A8H7Z4N0_AJECA|nr:hypothetical protein I7I52_00242 [Histoplasma capsulatum]QSS72039.1 hypothetical protein I7I50_03092 [Histoplasma capsulatum G186AR]